MTYRRRLRKAEKELARCNKAWNKPKHKSGDFIILLQRMAFIRSQIDFYKQAIEIEKSFG